MDDRDAAAPEAEAKDPERTEPPKLDEAGVQLTGDYPDNHRLRAEALAKDGKEEDPDGIISAELIADASTRLEGEERARLVAEEEARKARPPVSANMKVADLEAIARKESIDLSSAANNPDRVRLIEEARSRTDNPTPPIPEQPTGDATETENKGEEA